MSAPTFTFHPDIDSERREDSIEIPAIAHPSRKPGYWRHRLQD